MKHFVQSLPGRLVRLLATALLLLLSYLYFQVKLYDFPEPAAFAGEHLYNPYQALQARWLKGNFHAHAYAWNGLTNGHQPGREVVAAYQALHYDIPCLTDYFSVNPEQVTHNDAFIAGYEHGVNIMKSHRLALGSPQVAFYDLPMYQNQSIRQYLVERLSTHTPVVAIAHPTLHNSHPADMLRHLGGYQCLEVVNHYRVATKHWDAALTAGKPVWLLANDDCHDVSKPEKMAKAWTLVHANSLHRDSVLQALAQGHTYGVQRKAHLPNRAALLQVAPPTHHQVLQAITVVQDTIRVQLKQPVDTLRFVGAHGKVLHQALHTDQAAYVIRADDPYVRVEAEDADYRYFFNPIIRYDGQQVPRNVQRASMDIPATLLLRLSIAYVTIILVFLLHRRIILHVLGVSRRMVRQPAGPLSEAAAS